MANPKKIISGVIIADEIIKSVGQFANDEIRRQNKKRDEVIELPNVVDLMINNALEQLNKKGFEAEMILVKKPKKEYAKLQANMVVKMSPNPTLLHKSFLPTTLIKLYYLNEEIIAESKNLIITVQEKQKKRNKKIAHAVDVKRVKNIVPKRK